MFEEEEERERQRMQEFMNAGSIGTRGADETIAQEVMLPEVTVYSDGSFSSAWDKWVDERWTGENSFLDGEAWNFHDKVLAGTVVLEIGLYLAGVTGGTSLVVAVAATAIIYAADFLWSWLSDN